MKGHFSTCLPAPFFACPFFLLPAFDRFFPSLPTVVFAAHEKLAVVNEAIARNEAEDGCPHPAIITFDDLAAAGKFANTSLAEVEAAGADAVEPPPAERARPDDVMVIMYTSGTTGNPKGVLISHSAALGSGVAIARKIPDHLRSTDFVILSFMPLAHVFGLAMDYTTLRVGGCVGFYGGDTRKLTDDIAALRPTLLGAVPRVYQRIHDAVLASIEKQNIVKRFAFNAAYFQKYWWLRAGQSTPYSDPIFFGAIREKLGGRLSILVSGGAPLPAHVMEFFRVCVCDNFLEGFGMTETCAIGISTDVDGVAPMAGGFVNAGEYAPYCTSEAKLVSVPSMNYFVSEFPPRGELCIRSTTQFLGYYQDPVRTAEVIDAEGWVHTGDVAVILPNGKIRVIDRVKNMFKLSQGEYVSAEYLEQTITHSSSVQQAFVHGDSQQNYPVAIIVPEAGFFQGWAPQHGLAEIATDMPALCKQKAVYEFIESEVNRLSQEHRLKGYELIKRIHLHPFPFDEARDFLTPSLKLKRHVLRNFFKAEIAEMYSQLPSSE